MVEMSALESTASMFAREIQGLSSAKEVVEKRGLEGMKKETDMQILWEPCLVEELSGVEVSDIACGPDHSLVLCRKGANHDLGILPLDIPSCPISIASGFSHSLAIRKDASLDAASESSKKVESWGWNQSCQLGRPGLENLPLVADGLAGECPVSVLGGRIHSIALTSKREVWVWAAVKMEDLDWEAPTTRPSQLSQDSLEGLKVLHVMSGLDHSLVLGAE